MRIGEGCFTVQALEGRRWRVTSDRSAAVAMFVSKRDAIQYAHACAQAFRPSAVRVLALDGTVEDTWVYGMMKGIRRADADAPAAYPDPRPT
jgi:hypothetical protein